MPENPKTLIVKLTGEQIEGLRELAGSWNQKGGRKPAFADARKLAKKPKFIPLLAENYSADLPVL